MAESSSQKTSSPEIILKEEPVTLDKPESPNHFLPASQVDFTFDEITFTTNNEVALLAKSELKRKQSSKHTSESTTKASKSQTGQSKKETKSSSAKDKCPSHLSPPTLVVGEMHKEAQQAVGGLTSLGATNEEGAHPYLSSDILKDTRSDFFTPDSLPDEPIIISYKSEEKEEVARDKDTEATPHDVHLLQSQKEELEQAKVKAEAEVASIKAKPSYPDINKLTKLLIKELKKHVRDMEIELFGDLKEIPTKLETFTSTISSLSSQVAKLKNIHWELPTDFLNLPSQVSSVQEKLKILDSLPSLLHKVTDTLNRFATMVENVSGTTSMDVPSVGKATASPAEGEKNTKDANTNLKDELVDLLGKNVVTRYYTKKLLFNKYCDKMLKRKKIPKITKCEVLTKKGPITLKIYSDDGSDEVISNLKVSDLNSGEWREVIQACPDKSEKGWKTIYDLKMKRVASLLEGLQGGKRLRYVKKNKAISLENVTSKVGIEVHQLSLKDCTWTNSIKKGLPKKAATPQVLVIQGGRIQKPNKKPQATKGKEDPTKNDACHHYKEVGHWRRNYHVYLAELIKKKKQVGTASTSESATRILNIVLTKKFDKTPYELWYRKVPNLSYLKIWGCEALVKRDTVDKLQQRSIKCIFVGYPKETMGYYFYFPPENKIIVARYAEFLENNLISQEASGRAVELEEIQNKDTSPSENTSENLIEAEGSETPQEDVAPICRSVRIHRSPKRLCLNLEIKEHSLGDLNEPTNYKAALLDPESNKWLETMNAEMQSMNVIKFGAWLIFLLMVRPLGVTGFSRKRST
ncbi:retrotransposon protein, putative, ty1-copia subclass [Tanacetum coccineum]|uniref:Retrotransposon protein, putative, ty1-copia subclass n=1 Tax=Tanacetum coccineum TaxID=301880 RepID=A0ABQ5A3H4_9ASTR